MKAKAVCSKAVAFQNAYESVHQIIRATEAEDYGAYLRAAATAMVPAEVVTPPTALDEITDIGERLHHAYLQAYAMKYKGLVPLLDKVSSSLGVPVTVAEVKGMWRCLEKTVLRPTGGVPWDLVRAQFVCGSMRQVCAVLEALCRDSAIAVVQVNDRFGNPKGGWADCSLYLHFPNAHFKDIIAEVQICHDKLLMVRKDMGAHDAYDEARFLAELILNMTSESLMTLPWSRIDAAPVNLWDESEQ
jgi:hypothetical protein